VVLNACGGGSTGSRDTVARPTITTISVLPTELTLGALGATGQLDASARDQNGNTLLAQFTWSSSDTTVVTVDSEGLVTGLNNGTATVTVRSGTVSNSVAVTVEQEPASIALSRDEAILTALDDVLQLEASVFDANDNAMSPEVTWESSDPAVVSVDDDGRITSLANGTTTVTATVESISDSVTVTVRQVVSRLDLLPTNVTLTAIGDSAQFQVMALDANGNAMDVTVSLSSSDSAVASVNAAGLVSAQSNGTVIVTATSGMIAGSATVTVDQQVASISIAPVDASTLNMIGATVQLQAIALDSNGHEVPAEFAWTSSDPSIATVDRTGLVTAQDHGMTDITVSTGTFSHVVTLNISLYPTVIVTPTSSLLEAFGTTARLEARVLDADGHETSTDIDWASSDAAIADVNTEGVVTARGNGTVRITAQSGDLSGTATVQVLQKITHIQVSPAPPPYPARFLFTSLGETVQFTAEGFDTNGYAVVGPVFTASSWDSSILSIDDQLLAKAVGNGDTRIDFRTNWTGISTVITLDFRVRQVATRLDIEPSARTFRTVDESHSFTAAAWDANGHLLPADSMNWESADRRIADVDTAGLVSITGVGDTTIKVFTAEGLSASATVTGDIRTMCEAGDMTPTITSVDPATLVEGATFMIEGLGFCAESAGNLVTVDRMVAAVEAHSETRLRVTVPQYDCLPSRRVALTVAIGQNRATRTLELRPDEPLVPKDVGRQAIWGAGEDRCLQFSDAAGTEAYLIGVQSTTLTTTNKLTQVRLIATTSEADDEASRVAATAARPTLFWSAPRISVPLSPIVANIDGEETPPDEQPFEYPFAPIELADVPAERIDVGPLPADSITFPRSGDIDSLPAEGDIVTIEGKPETWLVYEIGTHALWLVDTDFVEQVETQFPSRIEELSEEFDNGVYPAVSDYFGAPDLGNIARLVVTISELGGIAGASGNAGRQWHEIIVGLLHGPDIVAHEFIHSVQAAGAWGGPHPRSVPPYWFNEAQAQLGTEQYLLVKSNRTTAQNYGREVAFDIAASQSIGWRLNFVRMRDFFGGAHPERPQECSWILTHADPCRGSQLFYHVGWSLLRWLTDQYGREYPGGESNLHREVIHGSDEFLDTIEQQMDLSMETLLARWAAALYLDDRVPNLDPDLQFTSWNLHDIYRDDPDRLMPLHIPFSDQEHTARIRDGSFWYVHVSGAPRPSTAIRARDLADRELPDDLQVWIVRIE